MLSGQLRPPYPYVNEGPAMDVVDDAKQMTDRDPS